jgi:hypothetical protein
VGLLFEIGGEGVGTLIARRAELKGAEYIRLPHLIVALCTRENRETAHLLGHG